MLHSNRLTKFIAAALLVALGITAVGSASVANAQDAQTDPKPAIARQLALVLLDAAHSTLNVPAADLLREMDNGKTLADVVKAYNGDLTAIESAAKSAATDKINQAVTDGKLKQKAADKLIAALPAVLDKLANAQWPGKENRRLRLLQAAGMGILVRETAKEANISQRDLLQALRGGKTLSDIATAHNADPAAIVTAAVKTATDGINKLVKNNKIKQDEADKLIASLQPEFTKAMTTQNPLGKTPKKNSNSTAPQATPAAVGTPSL